MALHNADIADLFEATADVLEIKHENPFRIRAYRNAARVLRSYGTDVADMLARGEDLTRLPGIGEDLAKRIEELVKTGKSPALAKIQKGVPALALDLLKLPGVGARKAQALYQGLHLHTLGDLERACAAHHVRDLPGFGEKTEAAIQAALGKIKTQEKRYSLATAASYADALLAYLKKAPGIDDVVVAGSFRRGRDTVGDLDLLATSPQQKAVIAHFCRFDGFIEIPAAGTTRATAILRNGMQVDLRVVSKDCYGAALYYFTGSKAHNIAVRRIAQQKKLKISEYGVFRGEKQIAGKTEESVFSAVGLPYIPPELREDHGEIEAARTGTLPNLITLCDLKGDLHVHSNYTDGQNTIGEMAEAARAFGLSYIAITDHSHRLRMVHGLDPQRLHRQLDEIGRLKEKKTGIAILCGIEVDILEDGSLDLPDSVLGRLDLVIGAIHSKFDLPRAKQTERILRAMDHPHFTILAHPTGRLISSRAPYDIDLGRIIRAAAGRGCFLELNADPDRLDLTGVHCQEAKAEGVLIAIGSDGHRTDAFSNLRYGLLQARRGWLEKNDVLNTRSLKELRPLLRATM